MLQHTQDGDVKTKNFSCLSLVVFTLSLFLSASLMFTMQPMVGKMLLPLAGGTPASWIVAMAFFQIALLAGYMFAWILSRFNVHIHTIAVVIFLLAGFFTLPVQLSDHAGLLETRGISASGIFIILLLTIGVPLTALSTVSSTLQRLFTATDHPYANDPYFLYAASNAGSLLGLLSYPIFVETLFSLTTQTFYWQCLYGSLIVACLLCVMLVPASKNRNEITEQSIENTTWKSRSEWLLLAFFPSSLLMGTTMYITTDIISIPLFWVLPLGLYLLTHIIAFSRKQFFDHNLLYKIHSIAVCLTVLLALPFPGLNILTEGWGAAFLCLASFFIISLVMHTRLASIRPHNTRLAQFYFFLALGGALGGAFNAFIAPIIFDDVIEYPFVALASCFFHPHFRRKLTKRDLSLSTIGFALLCVYVGLLMLGVFTSPIMPGIIAMLQTNFLIFGFVFMAGTHSKTTLTTMTGCLIFVLFMYIPPKTLVVQKRNFFGVMRVLDTTNHIRYFEHGTTLHGTQSLKEDVRTSPATAYYGTLQDIVEVYQPKHVGLIGLGAGIIRCYHASDRRYTMYEVDRDVVKIAKKYFDFLANCGSAQDTTIIGDGRLELEKRKGDRYDLLILDAFSSDSIPVHLLTIEALQLYQRHLTKNGIITIHISNRYLNLRDIIVSAAEKLKLQHLFIFRETTSALQNINKWMILAPESVDLSGLRDKGWETSSLENVRTRYWTDNHSNILSILRIKLF